MFILYGFKKATSYLTIALKIKEKPYFVAALGSVFQFVGSVYALGIAPNSLIPPAILATTPLASLLVSSFFKEERVSRSEYVSAFGVITGLILIFIYK